MDALATLAPLVTNNNNEEVPNDPGKMFIGKEETNTQMGYLIFMRGRKCVGNLCVCARVCSYDGRGCV